MAAISSADIHIKFKKSISKKLEKGPIANKPLSLPKNGSKTINAEPKS